MSNIDQDSISALKMNSALANALDALKAAKAKQIPTSYDVLLAPNGSAWYGLKNDHSHWKLIKHREDSYNVEC
jgi:hypothetical protein